MRASANGSASRSAEPGDREILKALFGTSSRVFARQYANRKFLLRHGAMRDMRALLGAGSIRGPRALDVLAGHYGREIGRVTYNERGALMMRWLSKRRRRGIATAPGLIHFFQHYDARFPEVRRLQKALCAAFGASVRGSMCDATLQTRGATLPRHCDRTDVVILQIFGTRHWRLQRNSDPPSGLYAMVRTPDRTRRGWSDDFTGDSPVVKLRPGSVLYVPRGWWHETRSFGPSFALVITVPPFKERG